MSGATFVNPFRPGAGHMPPYLAGRQGETDEFLRLLKQNVILENMVLTGLRGVGKTVLLETFKPLGIQNDWAWVSNDFSESSSITEERLAVRLITDLSLFTASIVIRAEESSGMGFGGQLSMRFLDSILRPWQDRSAPRPAWSRTSSRRSWNWCGDIGQAIGNGA